MKKMIYCLVALVLIVGFFAYSALTLAAPPPGREIQILGGPAGFNYYVSVATAEVLTRYGPGIRASAIETVGPEQNLQLSRNKDPNSFIFYNTDSQYLLAYTGTLVWKDKPVTDQKWICGLSVGHHGVATLNPKLKRLEDLNGKSLALIPAQVMKDYLGTMFDLLGIKVTLRSMGFAEQYSALRDGLVDAAMWLSNGLPGAGKPYVNVPPLQQVAQTKDVYGIPFPHDLVTRTNQKVSERFGYPAPYFSTIAPRGTLPTQTEPMEVYSMIAHGFIAKGAADEKLIYDITQTLVRNSGRLPEVFPSLAGITPDLMVQLMGLGRLKGIKPEDEIHPGALRYYKEVGLWPKAWEKRGEIVK